MKQGMRGAGSALPAHPEKVGMPLRPFLWTLDQLAVMLNVEEKTIRGSYVYYEGRSTGVRARDKMTARDIAPEGQRPDWRVAEREFLRWLKVKGFRVYERGVVTN